MHLLNLVLLSVAMIVAWGSPARAVEIMPQLGHTESVRCVAFSKDGRLALSGGESFRIWDVESGMLLQQHEAHNGQVNAILVVSEALAFTGGYDVIIGWDLPTGERKVSLRGGGDVKTLASSRDGTVLASGGNNRVTLWDIEKRSVERTFDGHTGQVAALALSPDGRTLVSAAEDYTLRIWDVATGTSKVIETGKVTSSKVSGGARTTTYSGHPVRALSFSPSEALFAAGSYEGVTLFSLDGRPLRKLVGHDGGGSEALAFSEDGTTLVSGGPDKTVRVFDVKTGQLRATMTGHTLRVSAVAFSPDGKRVLSGSGDKSVRLWSTSDGGHRWTFRGHIDSLAAAAFSSDGRWLLTGSGKNSVGTGPKPPLYLWDAKHVALRRVLVDHEEAIVSVAFSPDGTKAVSGARDNSLVLWDIASGAAERRFIDMSAGGTTDRVQGAIGVSGVAFSPDGRKVAAACSDGFVRVWNINDGQLQKLGNEDRNGVAAVAFLPDGGRLLAAGYHHELRLFELSTGTEVRRIPAHGKWGLSLSIAADGRHAISSSLDRTARVWDLDSGRLLRRIDGVLPPAAISPDGKLAATASNDGVALFDVATGRQRARWRGHRGQITALTFSGDGKLVLSASYDGTARLWHVEDGKSVALAAVQNEWLSYSDDGYFDASRRGGELVAAVDGMRGFRIDQLALRNNRPDILLERMGLGTPGAIEHFAALYRRRLDKIGLREEELATSLVGAPVVTLDAEQSEGVVELTLSITPGNAPVKRYQIYADAVPLFGAEGKPHPGGDGPIVERVELLAGSNEIEVSAFDAAGRESLRVSRAFSHRGEVASELYFVGFGVSKHRDSRLDLRYASKDVSDLASALAQATGLYRKVHRRVFLDDQVTRQAIVDAKRFLEGAGTEDTVILMVAGHGIYSRDAAADYYFITHDTDVTRLTETAAPFAVLEELLQGIAPRRKLFLLDTCESGERDQGGLLSSGAGARGLTPRTTRALTLTSKSAAPRSFLFQRDRYIHYDLLRRSGAVVFSSSTGDELSYETDEIQNGVFTEALLEALTSPAADSDGDGSLSVSELHTFVAAIVARQTADLQHPVIDRDNPASTILLPLLPKSAIPADPPLAPRPDPVAIGPDARGCYCAFARPRSGAPDALSWLALPAVVMIAARRRRAVTRRGSLNCRC